MNFDWSKYTGNLPWLKSRTVYLTRAGSFAYGTNIATSDEDWRGVAIAPPECYLGIVQKFEQAEVKEPDLTVFEFRKFVTLAAQSNPNILEILFTDLSDIEDMMWYGKELRGMRDLFVTKRARATFAGYATSQLKKIKHGTEHSVPGSPRYDRIQKYGYCTKNAMHLVRLLRMCREILETGHVNVKRKDAAELLSIRNGAWTLKELCEYAESEDKELDSVCEKSILPEQPNMKEIDRRTVEIMKAGMAWL
jgi:uncharacterized protein